jgi:hypothetical protein
MNNEFGSRAIVHRNRNIVIVCLAIFVATGFSSFAASASTVSLPGTGAMVWTAEFLGSSSGNTQTTPVAPQGNNYSLAVPGQYTFTDTFTNNQSSTPLTGVSSPVGSYAFQDTYEFSLSSAAAGDLLTISLNLGGAYSSVFNISDLQFRLYEVPTGSTPGLTIPAGSTVVTGWTGVAGNDNGTAITANFTNAQSGTYFLDVAGTADGTSGGTYIGQLNLTPVPLPAGLPLLLSGLAGLGAMVRRRKALSD